MTSVSLLLSDLIDGMILGQLLESVHTLIASKTRDILRPALGLTKVICAVTEDTSLAQYVQPLVNICSCKHSLACLRKLSRFTAHVKMVFLCSGYHGKT